MNSNNDPLFSQSSLGKRPPRWSPCNSQEPPHHRLRYNESLNLENILSQSSQISLFDQDDVPSFLSDDLPMNGYLNNVFSQSSTGTLSQIANGQFVGTSQEADLLDPEGDGEDSAEEEVGNGRLVETDEIVPCKYNYEKAECFDVYVENEEGNNTNTDYVYNHDKSILFVRKEVKVKFLVGQYLSELLQYEIRLSISCDTIRDFCGRPCPDHANRDFLIQSYNIDTRYGFEDGKLILNMRYPMGDNPWLEFSFCCNNSDFKKSKFMFDLLFELHDKLSCDKRAHHGTVLKQSKMLLKVCASPARDAKASGYERMPVNSRDLTKMNERLKEPSSSVFFLPIWGTRNLRSAIDLLGPAEISHRYHLEKEKISACHNSQIAPHTEIQAWLARFNLDRYANVFRANNVTTMVDLMHRYIKNPNIFKQMGLPNDCRNIVTKSFINWLTVKLHDEPAFMEYFIQTHNVA